MMQMLMNRDVLLVVIQTLKFRQQSESNCRMSQMVGRVSLAFSAVLPSPTSEYTCVCGVGVYVRVLNVVVVERVKRKLA